MAYETGIEEVMLSEDSHAVLHDKSPMFNNGARPWALWGSVQMFVHMRTVLCCIVSAWS